MIGIYCIENIITGKRYIGASNNVDNRWSVHKSSLRRNIHHNRYLQEDWNTYGEDSFKHYVLEECKDEDLDRLEAYYVSKYDNLYNQTSGGGSRRGSHTTFSDDMKHRMSEKRSGISPTRTQAVIDGYKVVSQKLTGRKQSKEHVEHNRQARLGKLPWNATKILCVELNTVFPSISKASDETEVPGHQIQRCLKSGNPTKTRNLHFVKGGDDLSTYSTSQLV